MSFELNAKAINFLIDAVEAKIGILQGSQKSGASDENLVADASNDIAYYRSLIAKLRENNHC
jgi:hypothetical protein